MSTDNGSNDTLRELAKLPTLRSPQVAPDGDTIALYYDVTGRNEIHLLDPATGSLEQLSDGNVPRSVRAGFKWSADGDRLFYHRDEGGDEQHDIHAMERDGTSEPVVEMAGQVYLQAVGEDGEILLFGSNRDGQMNIFRHDLSTGESTKLTEYERAARSVELSPNGDRFAFSTNESEDYENQDVYVADIDGTNVRNLEVGEVGAEASPADWGPEGERLLLSDNTTDLGRSGIYDITTDEITWFGGEEYDEQPSHFLPGGDRFIAQRSRGTVAVPVVYDIETGVATEFDLEDGVTSVIDERLGDGRDLLYHTTATRRPELVAYDLESDTSEVILEAEYGPFDPAAFVSPEEITFTSDGIPETPQQAIEHEPFAELEITGLLFDSGQRPSPLIVNPHGGPRARDVQRFSYRTQFLLSRGFSVLQINYRGSSGRGRAFVEELYDDWGGAEQGDIATGVEHVCRQYDWIDEDRIVVYGGSYGGYSTNWQIVQYPELYDAAITWVGVSELTDMYENTMPNFRTELMVKYLGHPDENPTIYEQRSPVTHIDNVDVPLLIVHGVNDRRVPVSQAKILQEALTDAGFEAGVDFEYEELGEEGHGSSDIDQKIRSLELLDDFLERRIGTEAGPIAVSDD